MKHHRRLLKIISPRSFLLFVTVGTLSAMQAIAAPTAQIDNASDTNLITGSYVQKSNGNTINVKALPGNKIQFHGYAYWPSAHPTETLCPGGPHTGEAKGIVSLEKNIAVYKNSKYRGLCTITLKFQGKKLVVTEQEEHQFCCGFGTNVTIAGTYIKQSATFDPRKL